MFDYKGKFLRNMPTLDFSKVPACMSEEEIEARYESVMSASKTDARSLVAAVRAHSETLSGWDMGVSFDEFAKRVEAGVVMVDMRKGV